MDFVVNNGLIIQNQPNQPATHTSGRNIDITITTRSLHNHFQNWKVHEDESLSDHRLITFEISSRHMGSVQILNKYNIRNADYNSLNTQITSNLGRLQNLPPDNPEDIDALVEEFQTANIMACNEILPKVKIRRKYVSWWNPELIAAKANVKRARRKYQNCCPCRAKLVYQGQYRRIRNTYKNLIKDSKTNGWRNVIRDESNINPYGTPYKIATGKITNKEIMTT